MSIMLAGLKAVRQRRRMRSTSSRRNNGTNDEDDDIGFDTSRFLVNNYDEDDDDLCPQDESPMISTQNRKKWVDNDEAGSSQRRRSEQNDYNPNHRGTGCNKTDIGSGTVKTATCSSDVNNTTTTTTSSSSSHYHNDEIIGNEDVDEDVDEDEEFITAGNEALLFIYGHNVNLYTDVFQLPSANQHQHRDNHEVHSLLLLEQINRSYNEQMQYLNQANVTLAMEYFRRRHNNNNNNNNNNNLNKSSAKYVHVMNTMDPKTFLDIQKDALHRAYTILMHDESRNEYDELLRLHHQDMLDENEEEQDLTSYDGNEEDVVVVAPPSRSVASMERSKFEENDVEEEEAEVDYSDEESDILTVQTTEEDEDYEDEDEEDEGRIRSKASPRNTTPPQQYRGRHRQQQLQQQHQYSPTDPMEFDMLIQNSLEDDEYYSQLYRNIKTRETGFITKKSADKDDVLVFDPFNLQGDDIMNDEHESNRALFPEKAIASKEYYEEDEEEEEEEEDYDSEEENTNETNTKSSYICRLPSSEDDDDEEDEITMGRLIELQEKMAKMKKSSLYLDDVLKSSSNEEVDSDDDYEECDEVEDDKIQGTAKEGNGEIFITRTSDDGSVLTKTKNYFLDDVSATASQPMPTGSNSACSVAMSTASTSSWTSTRSSSAPTKKENKKTSRRKGLQATVRNLVKTIGSKSKSSTPRSAVADDEYKFPEQEVYGSCSNNSVGSQRSRSASSSSSAVRPKMIDSSSFDTNGLNLSNRSCDTTTTSSALVSHEDDEVAEIENLLSIASTFSAMDAAAVIAERVRNRKSSTSNIYDEEDGKSDCLSTGDDNTSHRSCSRRHLSRFESDNEMILEEDDDYDDDEYSQSADGHGWSSSPPSSASRGIFASCIDGVGSSIDNTLDSVERVFTC